MTSIKSLIRNPIHFLACGLGSGLLPWFPGTWGTLMAIPFYLVLQYLLLPLYLLLIVVSFILGCWLCDRTARDFGVHDHSSIVWDEMVGYWITMLLAPKGWLWILIGFILFRGFDIVKPWPIGWVDKRLLNGTGIMLDDVIAGVFALICLQLIRALL